MELDPIEYVEDVQSAKHECSACATRIQRISELELQVNELRKQIDYLTNKKPKPKFFLGRSIENSQIEIDCLANEKPNFESIQCNNVIKNSLRQWFTKRDELVAWMKFHQRRPRMVKNDYQERSLAEWIARQQPGKSVLFSKSHDDTEAGTLVRNEWAKLIDMMKSF